MLSTTLISRGTVAKRLGIPLQRVSELDYRQLSPVRTPRGYCYDVGEVDRLLTRKAVARRLGKSVAAIRAAEGRLLHPTEGPNGVRLFDPDEVERVVGKPLGERTHSSWFRRLLDARQPTAKSQPDDESASLRQQNARLRRENAELRLAIAEFTSALGI